MTQTAKAASFAGLHVQGRPISLYNVWDAGSPRAVVEAGAPALATSSWAPAAAQCHRDGEELPFERLLDAAGRIAASVDVQVSVDFEGGYGESASELSDNLERLLDLGVTGINIEDRAVKGQGLYGVDQQARRIGALRKTANRKGIALFIHARTDLFLGQDGDPALSVDDAVDRARAYAGVGASGFFIPGLVDENLIARICAASPLPVNVMMMRGAPSVARLAAIGVSRIGYGTAPYASTMTMAALSAPATADFSETATLG